MKKTTFFFILISISFLYSSILYVDKSGLAHYTNLKDAVSDAVTGDTISLAPDTYTKSILINKSINITGSDSRNTVIFIHNKQYALYIKSDIILSNLTITNTTDTFMSAGIFIKSASPVIQNCIIKDNKGYGILAEFSSAKIIGNEIFNNQNDGIYSEQSNITVKLNYIFQNNGDGISVQRSQDRIINNYIFNNTDAGIQASKTNNTFIVNNIFADNKIDIKELTPLNKVYILNNKFKKKQKNCLILPDNYLDIKGINAQKLSKRNLSIDKIPGLSKEDYLYPIIKSGNNIVTYAGETVEISMPMVEFIGESPDKVDYFLNIINPVQTNYKSDNNKFKIFLSKLDTYAVEYRVAANNRDDSITLNIITKDKIEAIPNFDIFDDTKILDNLLKTNSFLNLNDYGFHTKNRSFFTMKKYDEFMRNPIDVPAGLKTDFDTLINKNSDLSSLLETVLPYSYGLYDTYYLTEEWDSLYKELHIDHDYVYDFFNITEDSIPLSGAIKDDMDKLLYLACEMIQNIDMFINTFSDTYRDNIIDKLPLLIAKEQNTESFTLRESRVHYVNVKKKRIKLLREIKKVNRSYLYRNIFVLSKIIKSLSILTSSAFRMTPKIRYQIDNSHYKGEFFVYIPTKYGDILVGGQGKNIYYNNPMILIDIGGRDEYYGNIAVGNVRKQKVSLCFDLSGDDLYKNDKSDYSFGAGFCGVGLLYDKSGNDDYSSVSYGQGCGLMGIGILYDESGNDRYSANQLAQGSGLFGIGLFADISGNDIVSGNMYSQGFGYTFGVGCLFNKDGKDIYNNLSKNSDTIRQVGHNITFSQGIGYGMRPYAAGGIGIFIDVTGDDDYYSDIFGQGSGYWSAVGLMMDYAGNDKYFSHRYTLGSGIHKSFGLLIDYSGDDLYKSMGVTQGCGHDNSFGLLYDKEGNDKYLSNWLSVGSGWSTGQGLFVDLYGDDIYITVNKQLSIGIGNYEISREYGSIGVMIDYRGNDIYNDMKSGNKSVTFKQQHGVRIDNE